MNYLNSLLVNLNFMTADFFCYFFLKNKQTKPPALPKLNALKKGSYRSFWKSLVDLVRIKQETFTEL